MESMSLEATSIKFSIEDKDLNNTIELQGSLADFFVGVILTSGLSKDGIFCVLSELLQSKDTQIIKTENKEIVVRSKPHPPCKQPHLSNKQAV